MCAVTTTLGLTSNDSNSTEDESVIKSRFSLAESVRNAFKFVQDLHRTGKPSQGTPGLETALNRRLSFVSGGMVGFVPVWGYIGVGVGKRSQPTWRSGPVRDPLRVPAFGLRMKPAGCLASDA